MLCLSPETRETLLTLGAVGTDLTVELGTLSNCKAPCNPLIWEQPEQNEQHFLPPPSWIVPKA